MRKLLVQSFKLHLAFCCAHLYSARAVRCTAQQRRGRWLREPHACEAFKCGRGARARAARHGLRRALEERGIAHGVKSMVRGQRAAEAAGTAAAAAKGLHACALVSCAARELNAGQHKKCSACRTVGYCSKEHQVEHWPQHKAACKAARAAAAQRSDT
jgi:hypothetical protein